MKTGYASSGEASAHLPSAQPERISSREQPAAGPHDIVLIESRPLIRESLNRSLETIAGFQFRSFGSVDEWLRATDRAQTAAILLSTGRWGNSDWLKQTALINRAVPKVPIVLLAEDEDPARITEALQQGVRGYIPTSVSLAIALEAIRLVKAGGTYIPLSGVLAAGQMNAGRNAANRVGDVELTGRQLAVLKALHRGKQNKLIAYELGMCEATVKVHVRNILRKFGARSRTQLAYMASEYLQSEVI